ncbi:hypothetical protein F5144DRAFT_636564 [Chaetomium tenue]|uniref:Uncharacterized protein n=1 Tax=Chaetomium tenue TaxID=1854479 RepID=A0ACB7PM05_9PEZI|nr:hypothetical protein F5144DRAFT_636564 [Chaetomium globosum]
MEKSKDQAGEASGPSSESTRKSQIAALVEAHKKLVDEAPIEEDYELLGATAMMLKAIQSRFVAKVVPNSSDNQQAPPMADAGAAFQELAAKFGELQSMVESSAIAIGMKGDVLIHAAKMLRGAATALGELQNMMTSSADATSSRGGIPNSAAGTAAAQREATAATALMYLQSLYEDSLDTTEKILKNADDLLETAEGQSETSTAPPPRRLEPIKEDPLEEAEDFLETAEGQSETSTAPLPRRLEPIEEEPLEEAEAQAESTSINPSMELQHVDDNAPEAAESQPEMAAENRSGELALSKKDKKRAKNKEKKERKKARKAEEEEIPPALDITATETTATEINASPLALLPRSSNPNYEAEVRGRPDDLNSWVAADLARCKHLGDLNKLCIVCDKKAEKCCPNCNESACYCSRECHVLDFPIHTKVCSDFAGPAADDKRPSSQHYRVLFFPAFRTKPEICWAAYRGISLNEGWFEIEHEDITQFYNLIGVQIPERGEGQKFVEFAQVLEGRPVGHLFVATTFVASKSAPDIQDPRVLNQSINALTKPGYLRPWFGPVMVTADDNSCFPGIPAHPLVKDITPRDVHSITRLLERCDGFCIDNPKLYLGKTITGLLINNPFDGTTNVMGMGNDLHQAVVPLAPLDYPDSPVALAFFLGLSWYIRRCLQTRDGPDKSGDWNSGRLRYVSYVFGTRAPKEGAHEGGDQSNTNLLRPEPALGRAGFPPTVILLHGSGKPVFKEKKEASRDNFYKFWPRYKRSQGSQFERVPSPYKWETDMVDRLGVDNPALLRNFVRNRIGDIWPQIEADQGFSQLPGVRRG